MYADELEKGESSVDHPHLHNSDQSPLPLLRDSDHRVLPGRPLMMLVGLLEDVRPGTECFVLLLLFLSCSLGNRVRLV